MTTAAPVNRRLILLGLFALALAIRLPGLAARDLWYDEQVTLIDSQGVSRPGPEVEGRVFSSDELRTRRGLLAVARYSATHDQPVYMSLVYLWTRLSGVSEWALRLPSALLGAATVPLLTLLGWRLLGPRPALHSGLLLAVSPLHVYYSQEARTYAVTVFLVVLAVWAGLVLGDAATPSRALAFGALAVAVPALHLLAGAALIPLGIWLAGHREFWRRLPYAVVSALFVVALLVPLGFFDSLVTAHRESGIALQSPPEAARSWAQPASAATVTAGVGATVTRLLGVEYFPLELRGRHVGLLSVPLFLWAVATGITMAERSARLLLLGGALMPLVVAAMLSTAYGHVVPLQDRYAAWSLPFFALLLAEAACRLPRYYSRIAVAFLVTLWAVFMGESRLARQPRLSLRSQEAQTLAQCSRAESAVLVTDDLQAAILAAWLDHPVSVAVSRGAGEEFVQWRLQPTGVCVTAPQTRCAEFLPPCPTPR